MSYCSHLLLTTTRFADLVYSFERLQYAEKRAEWDANVNADKVEGPSTTYGAEHLCRLLGKMPPRTSILGGDQTQLT